MKRRGGREYIPLTGVRSFSVAIKTTERITGPQARGSIPRGTVANRLLLDAGMPKDLGMRTNCRRTNGGKKRGRLFWCLSNLEGSSSARCIIVVLLYRENIYKGEEQWGKALERMVNTGDEL